MGTSRLKEVLDALGVGQLQLFLLTTVGNQFSKSAFAGKWQQLQIQGVISSSHCLGSGPSARYFETANLLILPFVSHVGAQNDAMLRSPGSRRPKTDRLIVIAGDYEDEPASTIGQSFDFFEEQALRTGWRIISIINIPCYEDHINVFFLCAVN